MYTIKDFGSSRFTECTSVTIHRVVFQFITIHEHQKMVDHSVTKISLTDSLSLKSDQHQFCLNNISAKKTKDYEN